MPPRGRKTITYNLDSLAVRDAFEEEEDIEDHPFLDKRGPARGQAKLKERNARAGKGGSAFGEGPSSMAEGAELQLGRELGTPQRAQDFHALCEMFELLDRTVVRDVYASSGYSLERSLQGLMELSAAVEASQAEAAAIQVSAAEAGVSLNQLQPGQEPGPCLWDMLHESVKEQIFSHLSARDLARVAWTCRDFASRVRTGRVNARSLVIPAGISLHGVVGMVAGHPNARAISLVRWGAAQLKESELAHLLTAISQGSCSSRRAVKVESLSLRGWTHASDGNILAIMETLQHLKELDLSDCSTITDAALGPLSRYQRAALASAASVAADDDDASVAALGRSPAPTVADALFGSLGAATPAEGYWGRPGSRGISRASSKALGVGSEPLPAGGPREGGEGASGRPGAAAGARGAAAGVGGDEEEDEDTRRAIFESLAMLAASPPATPSSCATPALGSSVPGVSSLEAAMAGVALGVGTPPPAGADSPLAADHLAAFPPLQRGSISAAAGGSVGSGGLLRGMPPLHPPASGSASRRTTATDQELAAGQRTPEPAGGAGSAQGGGRGRTKAVAVRGRSGSCASGRGGSMVGGSSDDETEAGLVLGRGGEAEEDEEEGVAGASGDEEDEVLLDEDLAARDAAEQAAKERRAAAGHGGSGSNQAAAAAAQLQHHQQHPLHHHHNQSSGSAAAAGGSETRASGDRPISAAPAATRMGGAGAGMGSASAAVAFPPPRTPYQGGGGSHSHTPMGSYGAGGMHTPGGSSSLGHQVYGTSPRGGGLARSPSPSTTPNIYGASPVYGSSPIMRGMGSLGSMGGRASVGSYGKSFARMANRATSDSVAAPAPGLIPGLAPWEAGNGGAAAQPGDSAEGGEGTGGGASSSGPITVGTPSAPDVAMGTPSAISGLGLGGSISMGISSQSAARGIEVLSLAGCSRISADGIRTFLSAPGVKRSLRALDISRCMRVTRAALLLPPSTNLRVLKAAGCQNLHEVVMQLPLTCPLQELWLNNCKHMTKLHLVAPYLTLLHVGGCKALGGLELRCPRLTQLLANFCHRLSEIDVQCPKLEAVNLFGCRHLVAPDLEALVGPAAGLRHLNLNGCASIAALELMSHPELHSLDLSGCKGLQQVRVASVALTTLTARACHRLQLLELQSRVLRTLDLTNCYSLRTLLLAALPHAAAALNIAQQQQQQQDGQWGNGGGGSSGARELVTGAARSCMPALRAAGCGAPMAVATGCEQLPFEVLQQLRVLKAAASMHPVLA